MQPHLTYDSNLEDFDLAFRGNTCVSLKKPPEEVHISRVLRSNLSKELLIIQIYSL